MKILCTTYFMLFLFCSFGQTCLHTQLSKQFDFITELKRITIPNELDSCIVILKISDKITNRETQQISYHAPFLFASAFTDCNFVRSYSTHKNINTEVEDYDFGDLIIADFNFDNADDFAIKGDSGGNAGPTYNFYIQKSGGYIYDKFLSENVEFFPTKINKQDKTLVTLVRANTRQHCETTYKYDPDTGNWSRIKRRWIADYAH